MATGIMHIKTAIRATACGNQNSIMAAHIEELLRRAAEGTPETVCKRCMQSVYGKKLAADLLKM